MNTTTQQESTALATLEDHQHAVAMPSPGNTALILDPRHMQNMMAIAEIMAKGVSTVPRHLQKNAGDCLAVVMQATQWGMNPFAVAQKTHLVNGTLGYEAQLVNAVITSMSPTKDRLNYEWFGDWNKVMGKFEERESKKKMDEDTGKPLKYRVPSWNIKDEADLGIKVWATMKGEDKPRELTLLLVQCRVRNSPLWADDPRQQIAYLAVKRWTRLHCPDVLLGVYTPDELEEQAPPRNMGAAEVLVPEELLTAGQKAADKGITAYQQFWADIGQEKRAALKPEHENLKLRATEADAKRTVDNAPAADAKPATATTATTAAAAQAAEADPAATSGATDAQPKVTYAGVLDSMVKAKNAEALDVAADWIGEVADSAQRVELTQKYNELRAKFKPT
jgi:RecT family